MFEILYAFPWYYFSLFPFHPTDVILYFSHKDSFIIMNTPLVKIRWYRLLKSLVVSFTNTGITPSKFVHMLILIMVSPSWSRESKDYF